MRILNTVVLFLAMVAAAASGMAQAPPAAPAQPAGAGSPASPGPAYYRIELTPSGTYVAIGTLVTKGNTVLFHAYPDGKLMSLRKTDVKKVSPITAQEAATPAKKDLVSIGNLAMQGGNGAPGAVAGPGGAAHPAPASGSPSAFRPSGPAVIPVHDGVAVTTAPPPD